VKKLNLLSFGEEAGEAEAELAQLAKPRASRFRVQGLGFSV